MTADERGAVTELRSCIECGAEFSCLRWALTRTCGTACYSDRQRRLAAERLGIPLVPRQRRCEGCGQSFLAGERALVGLSVTLCRACRSERRAARERAWQTAYHRRVYVPRQRPVSDRVPFSLRDDAVQERALAALEGRSFDMRTFKRANCPWQEWARIPEWRL